MRHLTDWLARLRRAGGGRSDAVTIPTLSAETLDRWLTEGADVQLLDIRDAAAFETGHLPGARHWPRERWEQLTAALDRERPTVVY